MKFFNGTPKRKSQFLIWSTFKNLIHPVRSPDLLKTEELEKAVEERTLELKLANRKLIFQNNERGKRAAELIVANEELAFQSEEKSKRAAELILANLELVFQNGEKGKRAAELIIANNELAFQNEEKGKRAAELIIANTELAFQNEEKGKRAVELSTANTELIYQNEEKEKRAAELGIANLELVFQNKEKEKLAAELIVANEELAFQNGEKEKRAAELIIANTELLYQNDEKEKRAAELNIANTELVFQNEEKGRRAAELVAKNTELEAFSYVSSHDLQEPLRKIMMFSNMILRNESTHLSEKGMNFFNRIQSSAARMQQLIDDLLAFSSLNGTERKFEYTAISTIVEQVKEELKETIEEKNATIEITTLCDVNIISFQFRQVMHNLIGNALKFSDLHRPPYIVIKSHILKGAEANDRLLPEKEYCHLSIADNGIGFEEQYKDQIFEVFKGLHNRKQYPGTGIGLAIVKKVIDNHHGIITVTSRVNEGTTFHIYIPVTQ